MSGIEYSDYLRSTGGRIASRWRTAPLWGLGERGHRDGTTLLHDGRARTVEEAILWHSGKGAYARHNFGTLFPRHEALLRWLEALWGESDSRSPTLRAARPGIEGLPRYPAQGRLFRCSLVRLRGFTL